jgi:hypothetical protein
MVLAPLTLSSLRAWGFVPELLLSSRAHGMPSTATGTARQSSRVTRVRIAACRQPLTRQSSRQIRHGPRYQLHDSYDGAGCDHEVTGLGTNITGGHVVLANLALVNSWFSSWQAGG